VPELPFSPAPALRQQRVTNPHRRKSSAREQSKHLEICGVRWEVHTADPSGEIQISGNSLAVPKLSAKCCAANEAHSSQMKTLLLSGPRLARKASQPPQPPTRDRTSCRDLPQNEQALHGTAVWVVWGVPSWAGSLAERVFQSAKPNCRATISRQALWESGMFRPTRESRRDFAIVLAFFCVNIV
jgi:hypothetical protein